MKWNAVHRLVGDPAQIPGHWEDGLTATPYLTGVKTVIDIGSGAGFPVVPLSTNHPSISFTAVEPNKKKWAFLQAVKRELDLDNLILINARDEELLGDGTGSKNFDAATSRATFELSEWLSRGLQLIRPGGLVIGFEGATPCPKLPNDAERFPVAGFEKAVVVLRKPTLGKSENEVPR